MCPFSSYHSAVAFSQFSMNNNGQWRNSGQKTKYETFWDEVQKLLREDVGLAAEERRHLEITHLARAISVRDLLEQVSACCPPGIYVHMYM